MVCMSLSWILLRDPITITSQDLRDKKVLVENNEKSISKYKVSPRPKG